MLISPCFDDVVLHKSRVFLLARPLAKAIAWQLDQKYVKDSLSTHIKFLEGEFKKDGGDFLIGDKLTGADIMMVFPLEVLQARGDLNKMKCPGLVVYLERIQKRDAYKRADAEILEVTGKVRSMGIE